MAERIVIELDLDWWAGYAESLKPGLTDMEGVTVTTTADSPPKIVIDGLADEAAKRTAKGLNQGTPHTVKVNTETV